MNENNLPDENLNAKDVVPPVPDTQKEETPVSAPTDAPTETFSSSADPVSHVQEGPSSPAADLTDPIAYPAKRPRSKSTIILLSLLGVVVVGAVTVLGIWLSQGGSLGSLLPNNSSADESQQVETPATASEIVSNAKAALNEQLATTYPEMTITESTQGPNYQVEGYNFYTSSDGSSIMISQMGSDDTERTQAAELARQTVNSSFVSDSLALSSGSLEDMTTQLTYQNDSVVCTYNDLTQPVWLACATKDDYKPVAEAVQPFVTVYSSANPEENVGNLVFQKPIVEASPTEGYQTAEVSISAIQGVGGTVGLFYSVNGNWKYFGSAQAILSCDKYNTDELKIAYEGMACFDETTSSESVVAKP